MPMTSEATREAIRKALKHKARSGLMSQKERIGYVRSKAESLHRDANDRQIEKDLGIPRTLSHTEEAINEHNKMLEQLTNAVLNAHSRSLPSERSEMANTSRSIKKASVSTQASVPVPVKASVSTQASVPVPVKTDVHYKFIPKSSNELDELDTTIQTIKGRNDAIEMPNTKSKPKSTIVRLPSERQVKGKLTFVRNKNKYVKIARDLGLDPPVKFTNTGRPMRSAKENMSFWKSYNSYMDDDI
jgi:hypothetical protein